MVQPGRNLAPDSWPILAVAGRRAGRDARDHEVDADRELCTVVVVESQVGDSSG
ncbi:hypothetical protein [Streptomyces sp. NBC_01465]|uniref:hypothetical protein n=1 Tax=Streptomyces sp. NBC_01465 TaxID=2903878 RepID=UPI002E30BE41|nr:hypothetical protein [Streptomyces sp. NBC_01465]